MAEKAAKTQSPFLMYKGRPLVRSGNTLYYGSMAEKYVIMMQILSTRDENDLTMADKNPDSADADGSGGAYEGSYCEEKRKERFVQCNGSGQHLAGAVTKRKMKRSFPADCTADAVTVGGFCRFVYRSVTSSRKNAVY